MRGIDNFLIDARHKGMTPKETFYCFEIEFVSDNFLLRDLV